jgi:hypothetical protein
MKLTAATAATLAVMATASYANELSFGSEATGEYNVDQEAFSLTLTPEAVYTTDRFDFTLSSDLTLYDEVDNFSLNNDELPTLDLEVSTYVDENLELYGKVSYDLETEDRGDLVVGATFAF